MANKNGAKVAWNIPATKLSTSLDNLTHSHTGEEVLSSEGPYIVTVEGREETDLCYCIVENHNDSNVDFDLPHKKCQ